MKSLVELQEMLKPDEWLVDVAEPVQSSSLRSVIYSRGNLEGQGYCERFIKGYNIIGAGHNVIPWGWVVGIGPILWIHLPLRAFRLSHLSSIATFCYLY